MSKTYFISDLHLSPDRPDITACFKSFLDTIEQDVDALYILGDLFEAWIGDDDINDFTDSVANYISSLKSKNIPVFFIHGNRDFLIRESFADKAGMTLLPENVVINLYDSGCLLMHGDELCTKDIEYQKFRKKARGWWWPRLVLLLPLKVRQNIAKNGREKSQKNQMNLSQEIMDVTPEEVLKVMSQNNVNLLIHGHTHRPAIHELTVNNSQAKRIVLGDWYTQGSILQCTRENIQLKTMKFAES